VGFWGRVRFIALISFFTQLSAFLSVGACPDTFGTVHSHRQGREERKGHKRDACARIGIQQLHPSRRDFSTPPDIRRVPVEMTIVSERQRGVSGFASESGWPYVA